METYVALLRGINVGGHKKVPMAVLRELLTKNNLHHVKTYIQTGNVVFQCVKKETSKIKKELQELIKKHFKFDVEVLVKTKQEFYRIFNNNPFQDDTLHASYFIVLESKPKEELKIAVSKESYKNEAFTITDYCIYTYCSVGYGKAKCTTNFFERKLNTSATARNYRTMQKILLLME